MADLTHWDVIVVGEIQQNVQKNGTENRAGSKTRSAADAG